MQTAVDSRNIEFTMEILKERIFLNQIQNKRIFF